MTAINANSHEHLTISSEELKDLKKKYEACKPGKTFKFKRRELLKEYAKYMIQHLETQYGLQ